MRLWHKDLIPYLPRQQLLAQWRECCCIARNIAVNGTPNHLLVNKILDYPLEHFYRYACEVSDELERRGYHRDFSKFSKWLPLETCTVTYEDMFRDWHNQRYFYQCFNNLQEKYDCGGISDEEWKRIYGAMILHLRQVECTTNTQGGK